MGLMAGNCCMWPCGDPKCQVCSVNARFPESAAQLRMDFDRQKMIALMTDAERAEYYASRRTNKGRKPRGPRKADMRDGTPKLAGERSHAGTSSSSRIGPTR